MSITSSKISFGTQFKAHIGANHAARHLRLKKLGNKQKKEKVVQSVLPGTVLVRQHCFIENVDHVPDFESGF